MEQPLTADEVLNIEPGFCLIYECGVSGEGDHTIAEVKALRVDREVLIEVVDVVTSDPNSPLLERDKRWVPFEQLRIEPF